VVALVAHIKEKGALKFNGKFGTPIVKALQKKINGVVA
jgi:hypothetical protein